MLFMIFGTALPQVTVVYHECFEAPAYGDSVISSLDSNAFPHWVDNGSLAATGSHAIHCVTPFGAAASLSTIPFSTVGMNLILFSFAHICTVDTSDPATLYVSPDNGITWIQPGAAEYLGFGTDSAGNYHYAYPSYKPWELNASGQFPANSWWVTEYYDLSSLLFDCPQALIRFDLSDGGTPGSGGLYGWVIDDIRVMEATFLGGRVIYASQPPQVLTDSTIVTLTGPLTAESAVNPRGGFAFVGLPADTFNLAVTTTKEAGGWNASDAYMVLATFTGTPNLLSGIYRLAGDVNGSGGIPNAADAIAIHRRFLHQIPDFMPPSVNPPGKPDWIFQPNVIIVGQGIQGNIQIPAICTGDTNASFILY